MVNCPTAEVLWYAGAWHVLATIEMGRVTGA